MFSHQTLDHGFFTPTLEAHAPRALAFTVLPSQYRCTCALCSLPLQAGRWHWNANTSFTLSAFSIPNWRLGSQMMLTACIVFSPCCHPCPTTHQDRGVSSWRFFIYTPLIGTAICAFIISISPSFAFSPLLPCVANTILPYICLSGRARAHLIAKRSSTPLLLLRTIN